MKDQDPTDYDRLYGPFADDLREEKRFFDEARDRAAYVLVTGIFPSHLRGPYTRFLRQVVRPYRKPTALDGRSGMLKLNDDVVDHLRLNAHPMVSEVRRRIRQGHFLQPSRGSGTRRNYGKIFIFRLNTDNLPCDRITVKIDGAMKDGWR